jgi:uracil-DNA glycosylase family 4
MKSLNHLNDVIIRCRKCPRLVAHREAVAKDPPLRYRGQKYWAKPLPGFGDPSARIYIVGLAPAANGGNRTGRIFTGDRSGDWLYRTLYRVGLANQESSVSIDDGLKITKTYISAAVRCAPPDNKPTVQEFENCRPYLVEDWSILKPSVIVALGSLAYNSVKKVLKGQQPDLRQFRFPAFGHGQKAKLPDGTVILCSYHPSQQNTFTGKLTPQMFQNIFIQAKQEAGL